MPASAPQSAQPQHVRVDVRPAHIWDGVARAARRLHASAQRLTIPLELRIAGVALAFRAIGAVVGFLANITIPDYQDQGFTVLDRSNPFWDRFARYDSGWYYGIASNGYVYAEGGRSNFAFFPLYPKLMGIGGRLLGGSQEDFYFAGIIVSWLSFALAMPLLYRLARLDLTREQAIRATAYAAVFPSAYFFGVVYSESLFFVSLVATVLALRSRMWLLAILTGAAMTATRVNGVMFVPALAWIAWHASDGTTRDRSKALLAAGGSLLGIGAYCVFTYLETGNPFAWYDAITRWGYSPGGNPFAGILAVSRELITHPYSYLVHERMAPYDTLNTLSAVIALAMTPWIWKRFGFGYALIVVLGLILPLSSGQLEGLGRYCAVLFPLSLLLGSVKGEARHTWLIACFVLFYGLGLTLFGNVHPLF
jgi:hypothetical protein